MPSQQQRSTDHFASQFTDGIAYRAQFDADFSLDDASKRKLQQTFAQTSDKAVEEPFFSIRQRLCSLAQTYASDNSVKRFNYQCLADSHTFLKTCLEQNIVQKNYMTLTVGDVAYKGSRLFNTSHHSIAQAISHSISTVDTPTFHVWLTLADLTVIDLTVINQLIAMGQIESCDDRDQWANIWRHERKGNFDYIPILSDDDFFSRLQRKSN